MAASSGAPLFLILALALLASLLSTIVMVIAIASDSWEKVEYRSARFTAVTADSVKYDIIKNKSMFNDEEGFYKVVLQPAPDARVTNRSEQTYYFRSVNGGIWKMCDRITEKTRLSTEYLQARNSVVYLQHPCFNYIKDSYQRKDQLDTKGKWLLRMQNSAASCCIVSVLCLFAACVTGIIGLLHKQVASLLITGVMYIVAGVFICFALVIIHTKIAWSQSSCYSLDTFSSATHVQSLCVVGRLVSEGWCVPVAWLAFCFCLFTFSCWIFLYRRLGIETSRHML